MEQRLFLFPHLPPTPFTALNRFNNQITVVNSNTTYKEILTTEEALRLDVAGLRLNLVSHTCAQRS